MTQYETYDHLAQRLNNMDSDQERWAFIHENPDLFVVRLDNDLTWAELVGDDRDEKATVEFDWYIGWADGVLQLGEALGMNFESV